MGVSAVVNGIKYYAGNEKLMKQVGVDFKETSTIGTAIYLCTDKEFLGNIVFADVIKTDSKEAISELGKWELKKQLCSRATKNPLLQIWQKSRNKRILRKAFAAGKG